MNQQKNKMNIILVLYNLRVTNSSSFISLKKIVETDEKIKPYIRSLIIVDNSTDRKIGGYNNQFFNKHLHDLLLSFNLVLYKNWNDNKGLAKAYNFALENIQGNDEDWLLLLDQDSNLRHILFSEYINAINKVNIRTGIILPKIYYKTKLVSPLKVKDNLYQFIDIQGNISGYLCGRYTGINSCSLMRIKFLKQIGGFNENYSIDYLDHITFYSFMNNNYKIYLLDVKIQHDISFSNLDSVSLNRYCGYITSRIHFLHDVMKTRKQFILSMCYMYLFVHCARTIHRLKLRFFMAGNKIFWKYITLSLFNKE